MESRTCVLFAGHCVRQRHASRAWIPPSTPAPPSSVYRDWSRGGACSVERRALCELMNPYTRQRRQEAPNIAQGRSIVYKDTRAAILHSSQYSLL